MGRWSRKLAPLFLDFAGLAAGERVIDIGCGTGSLTFALPERANISTVEAIDYEEQFIEAARERNIDPRINIQKGDACNLPFADRQFDRALSMLVLHFVSDPQRAVAEMQRVVRPGGVAAATVWDVSGGQPGLRIFWDTAAAIEPSANDRRRASLSRPMTQPGELAAAFARANFLDVTETILTIHMDFANFEDYRVPMFTAHAPHADFLASLPQSMQQRIEDAVKAAYLHGQPDGPRSFVNVAWAVRGTVPGARNREDHIVQKQIVTADITEIGGPFNLCVKDGNGRAFGPAIHSFLQTHSRQSDCWIADSIHLPPTARRKVHSSVTSDGSCSISRPSLRSTKRSLSE
jgi:SAM-dependent methyltransferase